MQDKLKSNILIRTSGGIAPQKEIGFGHIYRCINLANELKSYNVYFLIEDFGMASRIFTKNKIKNIKYLETGLKINDEIQILEKFIKEKNIDLVIVDKFKINKLLLKTIKKITKLVYIADLDSIHYPCNLIVNGFIGYENSELKNKFNSKCLIGPKYQILNKEFIKIPKKKKQFKLLVSVGGYDEGGIIDIFLSRWMNLESKFKTKIILGPGTSRSKIVKHAVKLYPNYLEIKNNTSSMFKEITSSQIGLCAGGITTYEFASQNIPFAIISQNNHQLITAKQWEKKLGILDLGRFDKISCKKMDNFLDRVCKNDIQIQKKSFVDGLGSKRIAKEITKFLKSN